MTTASFVAVIRGIPEIPSLEAVNIRNGPGLQNNVVRKAPVGQAGLDVLDVQLDANGSSFQGKVYHWFRLRFPDGGEGWVRDDLIDVEGDGTAFGFDVVPRRVIAFSLTRDITNAARTVARTTSEVIVALTEENEPDIAPRPEPIPQPMPEPPVNSEPASITVMGLTGLNMRSGPGTQNRSIARIPYQTKLEIVEAAPGDEPGDPFQWIRVNYNGREGWVREDFTRLQGNFEAHGLGFLDQYPSPVRNTHWVRDFNIDPNKTRFTSFHKGWDHGGDIGEPLLAGPSGGVVTQVAFCRECGSEGASALALGFQLNDNHVLNSDSWNFGFGHYVVVRYNHDILPQSTHHRLAERSLSGAHLFVIYAHMQDIEVSQGQQLDANQRIGTLGNSGNSTGPHLHLEMRAGTTPDALFYSLRANLMTPGFLFLR